MLLRRTFVVAILWVWSVDSTAAEDKHPLAIDDVYRFDAVTELAVAPDRQRALYTRDWAAPGMKIRRQSIWLVAGTSDRKEPLEAGEPDGRKPIWSPDGKWIAFLSTRSFPDGSPAVPPVPPYSDVATDIWLNPAAGGKAIPLAGKTKPYGRVFNDGFYGRVAFSPDGKRLAFVADDGREARSPEEIATGITVVREDQGEGYTAYGTARLWVADLAESPSDVAATNVRCLTTDDAWYGDPQWSPDGSFLVAQANRTADRESVRFSINKNFDLWRIDVADGAISQLTTGPGPEVSPRFNSDGSRLVCLSSPRKGPHADLYNLLVVDLAPNGPSSRVLADHHGPAGDKPSHAWPSFPLPADAWLDDDHIVCDGLIGVRAERQVISLENGKRVAAEKEPQPTQRADLHEARRRLTPPSHDYLQDRELGESSILNWKSTDGLTIDGVLTLPPASVAKPPYKLLVHPHGGPHGRSTEGFNFTAEIFAAHGFAVFQPNFRGSTGYGRKFLDADRADFGGGDMRDILTGIDELVRLKIIDPRRQFVYGSSYGGFMTNWLVSQTTQFRAASTQNSVTDLNVMWGVGDLQSWTEYEMGGLPWEVPAKMRECSPITYVAQVRTPTLVLHADHDRRCPLAMGTMWYRALKKAGVETEMVVYHDERHGLYQLPHQADVYRRTLAWFAKHDLSDQPRSNQSPSNQPTDK